MAMQLVHITDKGNTRATNQDSFCVRIANFNTKTISMIVVCDGMGGLKYGELASTAAVRGFERWFDEDLAREAAAGMGLTENGVFLAWHRLLEQLHTKLVSYAAYKGAKIGTTVSALLMTKERIFLAQIGDSRIYLDNGSTLTQLTQDQTLAMREYEAGRLSKDALPTDSRNSILLQCLGSGKMEPAFACLTRPDSGAVLLCSDGFYHALSPQMIHRSILAAQDRAQLQQQLEQLAAYCRMNGETDNLTAVLLRWDQREDLTPEHERELEVWARISGVAAAEGYEHEIGGIV